MSRYKIACQSLEDWHGDEDQLLTIIQAAKALGVTQQSVTQALDASRFTCIIDTEAPARQGRRLLLRKEVVAKGKKKNPTDVG